jgi:hypothetical protein
MKYLTLFLTLFFVCDVFAAANSVNPKDNPDNPRIVNVTVSSDLSNALNAAKPGDVILLKNGTYTGPFEITNSGTLDNPIIIRGESLTGVKIVQTVPDWPPYGPDTKSQWTCWDKDSNLTIRGSHIYVENLTVVGGNWGIKLRAGTPQEGVVIRNTRVTNVYCGISLWEDPHSKHYICDNKVEGRLTQEARIQDDQQNFDGKKAWGIEGISFNGNDLTICHNALSGFGDTINNDSAIYPTNNLDVYGNDILFGGDDGLEIDADTHNARIFQNRVSNSGTGISVQPDIANPGPYYIYRNVIYNVGLSYVEGSSVLNVSLPFKFKNNADNIYLYHNTSVRAGPSWDGTGQQGITDQQNNLILGTTTANPLPIFDPADPILNSGTQDWKIYRVPGPLTLAASSYAINAGVKVPGYNDDAVGAPDLGAYEYGQAVPLYGVRSPGPRPNPPTGLVIQ